MIDGTIPCPGTDRKLGGLVRQIMMPHFTDINQSSTRGRRAFIFTSVNPETFELPEGIRELSAKKLDLETYKAAIEQF